MIGKNLDYKIKSKSFKLMVKRRGKWSWLFIFLLNLFVLHLSKKHKMRKLKIKVTLVSWGRSSLWHFAANKSHDWSSCLLLPEMFPCRSCWMVYLFAPRSRWCSSGHYSVVNAHFGEVRCSIFRLDVLDNRQHWWSLKAFRSSACVDEFPCCLLVQGEDALARMLMLFLNDVLQKHGKQEWRWGNRSTLAWKPPFMGEKSLTSRCRCSSRAAIRLYPRRCVSCRRLCAKWSYVCSQHVCKVAPPLWEATSEPLIHFSTVRRGEKWISQQIQVSICNKHFTCHCTQCPPRGRGGRKWGGWVFLGVRGSLWCKSPLAALPCDSGVTQLNTVADLWCTI